MKFSVLLPTRNRLALLKYAIESVRRQDYADWEVCVSDNASDDDIGGYVRSLNDARVLYRRTDRFVGVTENWNNALEMGTGDYALMLGDDDCLLRGYFSTVLRTLRDFPDPDVIATSAYVYAYPGVVPDEPDGYLETTGYASFLRGADRPFWLGRDRAVRGVRHAMKLQLRVGLNMQFAAVSRRLVTRLRDKGPFFQSQYPDYYGMNVSLLTSERTLVIPYPLVAIGISPKSFGFFLVNSQDKGGAAFLNSGPGGEAAARLGPVLLPGTHINTGWLFTMDQICTNYGREYGLRPSYWRYRLLQALAVYKWYYVEKKVPREVVDELNERLRPWERAGLVAALIALQAVSGGNRWRPFRAIDRLLAQFPPYWVPARVGGRYENILEVFDAVDPLNPPPATPRLPGRTRQDAKRSRTSRPSIPAFPPRPRAAVPAAASAA